MQSKIGKDWIKKNVRSHHQGWLYFRGFGTSAKPRQQQNEPTSTSPNIAKSILGEAEIAAKRAYAELTL